MPVEPVLREVAGHGDVLGDLGQLAFEVLAPSCTRADALRSLPHLDD